MKTRYYIYTFRDTRLGAHPVSWAVFAKGTRKSARAYAKDYAKRHPHGAAVMVSADNRAEPLSAEYGTRCNVQALARAWQAR